MSLTMTSNMCVNPFPAVLCLRSPGYENIATETNSKSMEEL